MKELLNKINVYIGEMKADINNENGTFDEMAKKCFCLLLDCKHFLWVDDETCPMVQLDKSIKMQRYYLDNVFFMPGREICFCTSNIENGAIIKIKTFDEIERFFILKFIEEVAVHNNYMKE